MQDHSCDLGWSVDEDMCVGEVVWVNYTSFWSCIYVNAQHVAVAGHMLHRSTSNVLKSTNTCVCWLVTVSNP